MPGTLGGAGENRPRNRAVACLAGLSRWKVRHTHVCHSQVPGEIKRIEVVLGPQLTGFRAKSRGGSYPRKDHEQGDGAGL